MSDTELAQAQKELSEAEAVLHDFMQEYGKIYLALKAKVDSARKSIGECDFCQTGGVIGKTLFQIRGFCYEYHQVREEMLVCSQACLDSEERRNHWSDRYEWETYEGAKNGDRPEWLKG